MKPRLTYGAQARGLLGLGLPLIGSHLAQMMIGVTDTIMMGWYGVTDLAAVVLASSTFFVLFILGSGFAIAVMGMIASALGAGDDRQVRRDARMALWLSAAYGILVLPAMWWSGSILAALGQASEVIALVQQYLRVLGWGMVPALLVMVLKSHLTANERTQVLLWVTLLAVLVNMVLNWMLIFGNWGAPEMGVRGAALASLVTQSASVLLLALYAARAPGLRRFALFQRIWRPDWRALVQVARLGIPVGLTGLAESGLFHASALMMGWIGTDALAAHGIALQLTSVVFMAHIGLASAATVRVGRAHGAGDRQGMVDAAKVAIGLSLAVVALTVLAFLAMPDLLMGLFLRQDTPRAGAIIALGAQLLACAALFQLFDAMQAMALGFLRGVQDTRGPMWIAALSYWVIGIPASYLLGFTAGLGPVGIWLGLVAGLAVAALLLMTRFWRRWGLRAGSAALSPAG